MKSILVILVSFSILSGTQSRNLESRVKCNIFDLSSGSSNSEFCDSRSDQLDHDDEKKMFGDKPLGKHDKEREREREMNPRIY